MRWQFSPFVALLALSLFLTVGLIFFLWRRHKVPGARELAWVMGALTFWQAIYMLELRSSTLLAATFWAKLEYGGIVLIPPLWLLFVQRYGESGSLGKRKLWGALLGLSLLMWGLVWTNERHELVWQPVLLETIEQLSFLELHHGPVFWGWTIYVYGTLLFGSLVLFQKARRAPPLYRPQIYLILLALLLPWLGNAFTLLDLAPWRLDITPFTFLGMGMILTWGLYRYQLFTLVPVARNTVIENMGEGVLVLDGYGRILDLNPAAADLLGQPMRVLLGQALPQPFTPWITFMQENPTQKDIRTEITLTQSHAAFSGQETGQSYTYTLHLTVLPQAGGYVLVLSEITASKRLAEEYARTLEELQAIVNAFPDLYFRLNQKGEILGYHATQEAEFYLPPAHFLNKALQEIFPPDISARLSSGFQQVQETQKLVTVEYTLSIDAETRIYEARMLPLPAQEYFVIVRELTHLRSIEQDLRLQQQFLTLLNELTLDAMMHEEVQALGQVLADRLGTLFAADGCYLVLWEETHAKPIPLAAYGELRATYPHLEIAPGEITLTASVLEIGRPLAIEDVFHTPYMSPRIAAQFPTRSMLGLPLLVRGQKLGAALVSFHQAHQFTPLELAQGEQAAHQIALALSRVKLLEHIHHLSLTDELTGLANRRHLLHVVDQEILRATRFQNPFAVLLLDIDHFKRVNDTWGHPVGDRVLQLVAQTCRAQLRDVDLIARYGGEEFFVLLPETILEGALSVAERLRQTLVQSSFRLENGSRLGITMSIGVVAEEEVVLLSPEALFAKADVALYQAKQAGRNCIVVYTPPV